MGEDRMLRTTTVATRKLLALSLVSVLTLVTFGQNRKPQNGRAFDVVIKGGMVYDGTGRAPIRADVGITGDRIIAVGNLRNSSAKTVIDATGLAVAPGFINMLSWSV